MSILVYTFGYKPKEPKAESWEFPSGLVIRILGFHCRGLDSIPGQRSEIPEASQSDQKKKAEAQRDICVLLLAATLLTIINTIAKTEKQPKYILMTAG